MVHRSVTVLLLSISLCRFTASVENPSPNDCIGMAYVKASMVRAEYVTLAHNLATQTRQPMRSATTVVAGLN
jgi:hypothetical protein